MKSPAIGLSIIIIIIIIITKNLTKTHDVRGTMIIITNHHIYNLSSLVLTSPLFSLSRDLNISLNSLSSSSSLIFLSTMVQNSSNRMYPVPEIEFKNRIIEYRVATTP